MKTEEIVTEIGKRFRTFGGGRNGWGNPIAAALKDEPLVFAAGVDVQEVVEFVLAERLATLESDNLMLVAERAKLREALEAFVKWDSFGSWDIGVPPNLDECMRNARAALDCEAPGDRQ